MITAPGPDERASNDLLVATTNQGKIREIKKTLESLPVRLHFLDEFPELQPVAELGDSYEQNATLKAVHYSERTGLFALADDSGLEVEALGGLPGCHSARYGGPDISSRARIELLLDALADLAIPERSARFVSFMVLAGPVQQINNQTPLVQAVSSGTCSGWISQTARGSNGFGYDPVFVPQGYQQTFGELSDDIKNRISHRARALQQMFYFLEKWSRKLDPSYYRS